MSVTGKNLHNISTFSAGEPPRTAIGMSGNDKNENDGDDFE